MKIDLYTFTYNDQAFIPFFLDYYSFVDKMIFLDDHSDDNTLELLKDHEVRQWNKSLYFDVYKAMEIKRTIWKESKADLIIFPDLDEILYKENIKQFLETNNFDVYQAEGFEMVSKIFPVSGKITDIKTGVCDVWYNKCLIFNPQINDMNWSDGCHYAHPTTNNISYNEIKLLHYKWLTVENVFKRRNDGLKRRPQGYYMTEQMIIDRFNQLLNEATEVI